MIRKAKTKVISFVAFSGTGKTTLIEKLIKELKVRGNKLALIKHDAHEFELDKEGKDTWKYKQAGADIVHIFSKTQCGMMAKNEAVFGEVSEEYAPALEQILATVPMDVDIVIVEGCRESAVPKIGVNRLETGKGLSMKPEDLVALVTDDAPEAYLAENPELVVFGLEDVDAIADYIESGDFELSGTKAPGSFPKKKQNYKFGVAIEDVLEILDGLKERTGKETVPLRHANRRVVAKSYKATSNFPPFRRSPLDGYAFRAEDTIGANTEHPVEFQITEEIPAGKTPEFPVKKGQAAKILTGAPVPKGADAIIRYEDTEFTDKTVKIFQEFKPDSNIVPVGEDFQKGYTAIEKGTQITAFHMGVMGILGIADVEVYKKPKVAFISTGSELVEVDCKLPASKIRNSSVYVLGGLAEDFGAESIYCGIAKDQVELIADEIRRASKFADMICTTGGASVGDYDLIMSALERIGAKILVWKVKMKPGMAFILANYNGKLFLGLSGNPGAAVMSFCLFGRMAIRKLSGRTDAAPEIIEIPLGAEIKKKSPGGRHIIGVIDITDGRSRFVPNDVKGNGVLSSLQGGQAIGIVPPNNAPLPEGSLIRAYRL